MKKFNIGIQLYSLRDVMETDFEGTLQKVKEMGYDGVEFAGLFGKSAAEIKNLCEEIGLVPISAHVPYADIINDINLLETYAEIGCKYVAIPYISEEYLPGNEKFTEFTDNLKKIGQKTKELGMQLCYHNHDFEFKKVNGEYKLDVLYSEVSGDLLETELDTCWINVGGENPSEYILKYSDRTTIIHLKDFIGSKSENMYALIGIDEDKKNEPTSAFEFRPLGHGVQNFEEILNAAEKVNVNWVIVEQDAPSLGKSSTECAKMSINYLKTLI